MRYLRIFLFLFLLLRYSPQLQAQMYDPANNNMPFMGSPALPSSYAEPGVNESNGVAQIQIPLQKINADEFTDLVSISYNSTGIRVDENASRVGLGWSLQAGGSITRVVCGLPDEHPDSGILIPGRAAWLTGTTGQMAALYKGEYDGEFDYYVLQAGPLNTKFFYDGTNYYCMPASGIKIERGYYLGVSNAFKVTDTRGIQYYFTLEEKVSFSHNKETFKVTDRVFAWQLTQVVLPNQKTINYQYRSTLEYWTYGGRSEKATHLKHPTFLDDMGKVGNARTIGYYVITDRWQYYKVHPLESITWSEGQVFFEYTYYRIDVPGDIYLNSVYTKTSNGQILSRYVFTYTHTPRMMLRSVQEHSFGVVAKPPYQFYYHPGVLPAIGTFSQDRFGYYNAEVADGMGELDNDNKMHQTLLPKVEYWSSIGGSSANYKTDLPGAERNVSPAHLPFMSLNKIVFPTGAIREFEFEPNTYIKEGGTAETYGPGMRVKRIIDNDGNGNKIYRKYTYQQGVYYDYRRFMVFETFRPYYAYAWVGDDEYTVTQSQKVIYRFSEPASLMPSLFPSLVTYKKVITEETDADGNNLNGVKENEYYAEPLSFYQEPVYGTNTTRPTAILLTPHFFYGTLLKSTLKKKLAGSYQAIQEMVYEYNFNEPALHRVFALYPRPISPFSATPVMYNQYSPAIVMNGTAAIGIHKYFYSSQPFHLNKTTLKEWGTDGSGIRVTQTEFFYEPAASAVHYAPIQIKQTLADGTTLTQHITRAAAFNGAGSSQSALQAIEQLKNNNCKGAEVERYSIKNEGTANAVLLNASWVEYERQPNVSSLVIPRKEFALKQQTPLSVFSPSAVSAGVLNKSAAYYCTSEVNKFTPGGKPASVLSRGVESSLLLNPSEEFLLASAQNAASTEIAILGMEWYEPIDGKVNDGPPNYEDFGNLRIEVSGNTIPFTNTAFAGSKALQLNSETFVRCNSQLVLKPGIVYEIYCWKKNGTLEVKYDGNILVATVLQTIDDWSLVKYSFTGGNGTPEIGGTCVVDEIKIMPALCSWSSTVFDVYGRVIATCDNNNNYTFYQYDNHGRLFREMDARKNILKQHTYEWQQNQN